MDENNVKISIITVVYNNAIGLERTILSVLNQTYKNYEYIIVDGDSTDGTIDIIKKYEKYLANWISEKDEGIYDAMNKGAKMATGELIAFLNSDDWYELDTLEYVNSQYIELHWDALATRVHKVKETGECYESAKYTDTRINELDIRNTICHQGLFVKRNWFHKVGFFDLQYKLVADYNWMLDIKNMGAKFVYSNKVTAFFSLGGASTKNVGRTREEAKEVALNHAKNIDEVAKIKEFHSLSELQYNNCLNEGIIKKVLDIQIKRLYIFGGGRYGRICYAILKQNNIKVEAIIDNNRSVSQKMNEIELVGLEEVDIGNSFIIISTIAYMNEMRKQLMEYGISETDFILYSDFVKRIFREIELENTRRPTMKTQA